MRGASQEEVKWKPLGTWLVAASLARLLRSAIPRPFCSFAGNKVANWSFLGDPGSLPSFVAKGMSCSFSIFASWALKVDRPKSSRNSSINVSRFWNTAEKTRKSGSVGVIGRRCQMLSEVFAKQMWPWCYLDSVHSQRRPWEALVVMIILCVFLVPSCLIALQWKEGS